MAQFVNRRCRLFLSLALLLSSQVALAEKIPIMQGVTANSTTQVVVLSVDGQKLQATLRTGKKVISPHHTTAISRNTAKAVVYHFEFQGLEKNLNYQLSVTDYQGKTVDQRKLKPLPVEPGPVKIAIASCLNDDFSEQKQMWQDLLAQEPNVIFLIGDNVYADFVKGGRPSPANQWQRFIETRQRLELFYAEQLVPVFSIWDDHDYGVNDGNRDHPWKWQALKINEAFFPRPAIEGSFEPGPGMASHFSAFGLEFFFLDDRMFRSPKGATSETHFGSVQESWLLEGLSQSQNPAWLLSGDQFFGGYHQFESYEGNHPKNFQVFLDKLAKAPVPVFFVSGDRHLAELMAIPKETLGYETYELTTSAIHARTYERKDKNPRQVASRVNTLNYAIVETKNDAGMDLSIIAYGPGKEKLFSKKVKVKR